MIILDLEATGVDAEKNGLISIGAFEFENPQNSFYGECKVRVDASIDKNALEINGFSTEEISREDKMTEKDLVAKFIDWATNCNERTFAGQNPSFDRDFLMKSAYRYHLDWPFAYRTIDLHSLCYIHMTKRGLTPPISNKRSDLNSDKIMNYVGLPAEPHPHNALNGAKFAGEAISRLLFDKSLLDEFMDVKIPWK